MNSIFEKEIWSLWLVVYFVKDFVEFLLTELIILFLWISYLKYYPMKSLLIWVFIYVLCFSIFKVNMAYRMATNLSRKRSWVIPRDCMPPSNSLKVRNLSPSVFHFLKAAFVSFFFALKIQLRNSIWKKNPYKNLTFVEVPPISRIKSRFEKLNNWLLLANQILPKDFLIKNQTYSFSLQVQNNFTADQTFSMGSLTETLGSHYDLWQCEWRR